MRMRDLWNVVLRSWNYELTCISQSNRMAFIEGVIEGVEGIRKGIRGL